MVTSSWCQLLVLEQDNDPKHHQQRSNVAQLQQSCKDDWISPQLKKRLIASYYQRLIVVAPAERNQLLGVEGNHAVTQGNVGKNFFFSLNDKNLNLKTPFCVYLCCL